MSFRTAVAGADDVARCADVLAEAFRDDPLMAGIWPDARARHCSLPAYFRTSLRYYHLGGGGIRYALSATGDVAAVSVWDSPIDWKQPLSTTIRAMPALVTTLRLRTVAALRIRVALDDHHAVGKHWYLANLGSSRSYRGQGAAAMLLADQLVRCDRERIAAYLVCTALDNIDYYQKFGFVVSETFSLPDGASMTSMWRAPNGG